VSPTQAWADDAITHIAEQSAPDLVAEGAAHFSEEAIEVIGTRLELDAGFLIERRKDLSAYQRRRARCLIFTGPRALHRCALETPPIVGEPHETGAQSIRLEYGASGNPGLGDPAAASNLKFNVSYGEDFTVYEFTCDRSIAVDVAAVRPLCDAHTISARFFSRRRN